MTKIKIWIQKLLLIILKKLDMPLRFDQIDERHLDAIESSLKGLEVRLPGFRSIVHNQDAFVYEYSKLEKLTIEGVNKAMVGEIIAQLGIDSSLNPIVYGFDEEITTIMTSYIKRFIKEARPFY